MRVLSCFVVALLLALPGMANGRTMDDDVDGKVKSQVELGAVHWGRELERAQAKSAKTGKPVFLLFQEIPGCETCQNFGQRPLSHPLLVEAIEDLFIPVVIHNNKPGRDAAVLKDFDEPSWNNPVVRFIDAEKRDVIARKDGVWGTEEIAARMVAALTQAKREVPDYLRQVASSPKREMATFAMHCYWEGEAKLGTIDGVANARSGWKDGLEVVQLEFDPSIVDYEKLVTAAQAFECASKIYAHSPGQLEVAKAAVGKDAVNSDPKMRTAKESDQSYYLRNSKYRHLPLTDVQTTKINGVLFSNAGKKEQQKRIDSILSPRQLKQLQVVERLLKDDETVLDDFVWPDDDRKLGAYAVRLAAKLGLSSASD